MPSQSFANPLNCLTNTSANSVQCVPNSSTAPTTVNTVAIGAYSAVSANFGIAVGNFTEETRQKKFTDIVMETI